MGVFDYYCLINGESCLLINSQGQDCSFGEVYLVDKDLTKKNKNNVFVFNGWMFSSSPSIAPFDHPVYDIWLVSCY